jgi:hypothetical protein
MNLPTLDPSLEYDIVSSIINAVGRPITITTVETRTTCTLCDGNDPFCPQCLGNPTTDVTTEQSIVANIRWKGSDAKLYRPEGQFMEGDCIATIAADGPGDYNDDMLKHIISVTVDGRKCVLQNWYFKGAPINRIYLILKQDSDVGGQRIG